MSEKSPNTYLYIFGAFIFGTVISIIIMLLFINIPPNNRDVVNLSIGAIIGYAGGVVSFFYGSSKDSSDKDKMLNEKPPPGRTITLTDMPPEKKEEENGNNS